MKVEAREGKKEMEQYMEVEKGYFSKIREREELRTRLEVLRLQLAEQQRLEQEGTWTKSNIWQYRVEIEDRILIALLRSKRCNAEVLLGVGLIHAV